MEKRVIKFRAWDTVMKWYVPDFDNWIDFHGNYYSKPDIGFDTPHIEIVKQYHYEIEQFTGRHDRDGKEIYEGDRIEASDMYGTYKGSIVWWNDRWCLTFLGQDGITPQYQSLMTVKNSKVVGHIHETN